MRFGRKLALQVTQDQSNAPYLSYKAMKEAINRTVRELRLYQSKKQALENWQAGHVSENEVLSGSDGLCTIAAQMKEYDKTLHDIVQEDIKRIYAKIREYEDHLKAELFNIQALALNIGLMMEAAQVSAFEKMLPVRPESREAFCQKLIELRMSEDPSSMAASMLEISTMYSNFLVELNAYTQYLEVNVAGFRKLLKRHDVQIPLEFRYFKLPDLGFHALVTTSSFELIELGTLFGAVIVDGVQRLARVLDRLSVCNGTSSTTVESMRRAQLILKSIPNLEAPQGFGPECKLVLEIQQMLMDPISQELMCNAGNAGFLYPRPGVISAPCAKCNI
jgi:hypothetical protein